MNGARPVALLARRFHRPPRNFRRMILIGDERGQFSINVAERHRA